MNFGAYVEAGEQNSPKNHHSRMIIGLQAAAIQTAKHFDAHLSAVVQSKRVSDTGSRDDEEK